MPTMNDYPMGSQSPPRRLIFSGTYGQPTRQIKKDAQESPQSAAKGSVRKLKTPPVQSDNERQNGDSTNARMARLLAPRRTR